MSSDERVDRRIWWLKVSKAEDRSSRMRADDLESAFAIRWTSVTESSAVSVEWPLLKPDCLASSLLFCERNNETWLKTTRSSVRVSWGFHLGLYQKVHPFPSSPLDMCDSYVAFVHQKLKHPILWCTFLLQAPCKGVKDSAGGEVQGVKRNSH